MLWLKRLKYRHAIMSDEAFNEESSLGERPRRAYIQNVYATKVIASHPKISCKTGNVIKVLED